MKNIIASMTTFLIISQLVLFGYGRVSNSDTNEKKAIIISVPQKAIDFISTIDSNILFFTSRDNPITNLNEVIQRKNSIIGIQKEFMFEMIDILEKLFSYSNVSLFDYGKENESQKFMDPKVKINGLGDEWYPDAFKVKPELVLFVTVPDEDEKKIIESGGGIQIIFRSNAKK